MLEFFIVASELSVGIYKQNKLTQKMLEKSQKRESSGSVLLL
jgi:hypothetical protein